jgi:hypothetical protein
MTRRVPLARLLSLLLLSFGMVGRAPEAPAPTAAAQVSAPAPRTVYLGTGLSEEQLVVFTSTLAASRQPAVVLLDSPTASEPIKTFLAAYRPEAVIPVGTIAEGKDELGQRLGTKVTALLEWERGPPAALWERLFPRAERVVVCPPEPRPLVLHAACLAGTLGAPLFIIHDAAETKELRTWLVRWQAKEVYAVGPVRERGLELPGVRLHALADAEAVVAERLRRLAAKGPVETLVLANAADLTGDRGRMSSLAPWVAIERSAPLLLTSPRGDDADAVVRAALKHPDQAHAESLIIVANLSAIPMERRPNPVEGGKDPFIEMEPVTPKRTEPFTLATGRLFHSDRGVVLLMLARPRLLAAAGPCKALVVSNPSGDLPLLEVFSRNTAKELRNAGYETASYFGAGVDRNDIRRLLPEQQIFLWEGHHETLVRRFGLPAWDEPRRPALFFLQSCLALKEETALPILERGAIGVIGSSTRTYSASGGALTLCYFDALVYEDRALGDALRQAKNFLLTYAALKEKRLGDEAKLSGANLRSAWAFTLWGDPTLKLPRPQPPADALPAVRHEVRGNTLVLKLPAQAYDKVKAGEFFVEMIPNARLAGLVTKEGGDDSRRVLTLVFAEVRLPAGPAGKTPRLTSKLPARNWVFNWDARRSCGYLLVLPRTRDTGELRFQVEWVD